MPTVNKSYASSQSYSSECVSYSDSDLHITAINSTYTQDYCYQLELAYGNHMMSEGGAEGIDKMFEGLSLNGKHVLDFGAGLGGVAFYLASQHGVFVKGVEINSRMVNEANQRRPECLKDKVSFSLINSDQRFPFPDESFDVVYSKGVIVHLSKDQREVVFRELHRVLKREGQLLINDWLSPLGNQWSQKMQDLIETESLLLFPHSRASYERELAYHGFSSIQGVDRSIEFAKYNHEIVERLQSLDIKRSFIKQFGEDTFHDHVRGYETIRDVLSCGELINLSLQAVKEAINRE